jgi:hypothetical protein
MTPGTEHVRSVLVVDDNKDAADSLVMLVAAAERRQTPPNPIAFLGLSPP